jgi:hypothetical protein
MNGLVMNGQTANVFSVDLGGGAAGSIGGNRSFGNGGVDLTSDIPGGNLSAKSNWWGTSSGLQPARVTITSGTVNSTGYLTSDPRP